MGANNKNIFSIGRLGQGLEHIQQMLKRCLACHANEWLGLAPGMRTHTRAPACHRDKNLESFSHNTILPREMSGVAILVEYDVSYPRLPYSMLNLLYARLIFLQPAAMTTPQQFGQVIQWKESLFCDLTVFFICHGEVFG